MNYADLKRIDVANGPGVRVSLFVSGCPHRCPECFNPEAWDFAYGQPFGEAAVQTLLGYLRPSYIRGLSLLGGEPFAPANQEAVLDLTRRVRRELPGKDIWCYTGYLFQDLLAGAVGSHSRELLEELDILVDGPFLIAQKNISLRFRGSENQRILQVPQSLKAGSPVLWDDRVE